MSAERAPFPRQAATSCPECNVDGCLQSVETVVRWWALCGVAEDGTLVFDGSFEVAETGRDEHVVEEEEREWWRSTFYARIDAPTCGRGQATVEEGP